MAFLTREQLEKLNFVNLGNHVFISDKASIYNASKISIGSYVRIDDFALISAGDDGIIIGNFVHIGSYSCMLGHSKITLNDYSGINTKAIVLSSTSDFTGDHLFQLKQFTPLNEIEGLTISINKPVVFQKVSVVGANSIVMPGVTIASNSGVGSSSMVLKDTEPGKFYKGNPAKVISNHPDIDFSLIEKSFKNSIEDKGSPILNLFKQEDELVILQ